MTYVDRRKLKQLSDKAWEVYNKHGHPKKGMEAVVEELLPHIAKGDEFLAFLEKQNGERTISRAKVVNKFKAILGLEA